MEYDQLVWTYTAVAEVKNSRLHTAWERALGQSRYLL